MSGAKTLSMEGFDNLQHVLYFGNTCLQLILFFRGCVFERFLQGFHPPLQASMNLPHRVLIANFLTGCAHGVPS